MWTEFGKNSGPNSEKIENEIVDRIRKKCVDRIFCGPKPKTWVDRNFGGPKSRPMCGPKFWWTEIEKNSVRDFSGPNFFYVLFCDIKKFGPPKISVPKFGPKISVPKFGPNFGPKISVPNFGPKNSAHDFGHGAKKFGPEFGP